MSNLEEIQEVCEKLESYLEILDENEDYDFIDDLDDPNQTLMGMMIARGYLRNQIEISSMTVPILMKSERILSPIIREISGNDND